MAGGGRDRIHPDAAVLSAWLRLPRELRGDDPPGQLSPGLIQTLRHLSRAELQALLLALLNELAQAG